MVPAFPLTWPEGIPRSKSRETGAFKTTLLGAIKNVEGSLRRFATLSGKPVKAVTVSSNVGLMGIVGKDPGVALWFTWDDESVCLAVDRYSSVASNLQAIHHILEARIVELRHGTFHLVKATFRGLLALPPPATHWTVVLGLQPDADAQEVDAAFKLKAMRAHPDKGGSQEAMAILTQARDSAMASLNLLKPGADG